MAHRHPFVGFFIVTTIEYRPLVLRLNSIDFHVSERLLTSIVVIFTFYKNNIDTLNHKTLYIMNSSIKLLNKSIISEV